MNQATPQSDRRCKSNRVSLPVVSDKRKSTSVIAPSRASKWRAAVLIGIHVLIALSLIGLVLIQHGKGADMGAAFGSGASTTVFGSRGAGSFLTRTTAVLAALFFATSIGLAFLATRVSQAPTGSVVDTLEAPVTVPAPAQPADDGSDVPTLPAKPQ